MITSKERLSSSVKVIKLNSYLEPLKPFIKKNNDKVLFFIYYKLKGKTGGGDMKCVKFIALFLMVVGALNWGLWGFFQYDLVADLVGGPASGWARFLYILIGIAGIYGISFFFRCGCSCCCKGKCGGGSRCG